MNSESHKTTISKASGILIISILCSRLLGQLRDTCMTATFGKNEFTDAYRLSFQLPDLVFYLLSVGALSAAFIPTFSEYYHKDMNSAWKFFSSILCLIAIFTSVIICILWVGAPFFVQFLAPGKTQEINSLIITMSRILLPAQLAFVIGSLFSGTLYVRNIYFIPALTSNAYNICIILSTIFLSKYVQPKITSMCWGAVIGAYIGAIIIPFCTMIKIEKHTWFSFDFYHPGILKFFKLALPVIFGLSLPALIALMTQSFVSYYPEGINTTIDLANKIIQMPLAITGQAIGMAAFPILSNYYSEKKIDIFASEINKSTSNILYISSFAVILIATLSKPIATLLFEYGNFTAKDSEQVSYMLQLYSVYIIPASVLPFITRAFYATQNTLIPTILNTVITILFYILGRFILELNFSYTLFPIISTFCISLLTISIYLSLAKQLSHSYTIYSLTNFLRIAICMMITFLFTALVHSNTSNLFFYQKNLTAGIHIALITCISMFIYIFIGYYLKIPISMKIVHKVKTKIFKLT